MQLILNTMLSLKLTKYFKVCYFYCPQKSICFIIPPANFVCRGYTVFTLSVRPSVRNALFP